jgi:hypothetical protein
MDSAAGYGRDGSWCSPHAGGCPRMLMPCTGSDRAFEHMNCFHRRILRCLQVLRLRLHRFRPQSMSYHLLSRSLNGVLCHLVGREWIAGTGAHIDGAAVVRLELDIASTGQDSPGHRGCTTCWDLGGDQASGLKTPGIISFTTTSDCDCEASTTSSA